MSEPDTDKYRDRIEVDRLLGRTWDGRTYGRPALDRLFDRIYTLEAENAKLRRQVEVPNLWLCETCGLQLNQQSFDPCTGEVGHAAVQEIPVCLNDDEHGPMRRQTWQENASAHADACDELASANAKMSEEPVNLRLLAAAAFLYIAERREGWEEGPSWTEAIDRIHDELSNAIGDVGIGEVTTWLERHDVEIRRTTPIDFAEMIRAAYAPPGQRGSK